MGNEEKEFVETIKRTLAELSYDKQMKLVDAILPPIEYLNRLTIARCDRGMSIHAGKNDETKTVVIHFATSDYEYHEKTMRLADLSGVLLIFGKPENLEMLGHKCLDLALALKKMQEKAVG